MISTVGKQMSTKQGRTREYGFHAKGCNRNSKSRTDGVFFSFLGLAPGGSAVALGSQGGGRICLWSIVRED